MSPRQIITAILIHLVVPALGIAAFLRVRRVVRLQGKASGQGDSPVFVAELFCLFAVYGGWLMVLLTALFWQWSGMASLGTLFLLFGAPIPMIGIGWHLRSQQEKSVIHRRAFWASWGYTPLLLGVSILGVLVFALLGAWERS